MAMLKASIPVNCASAVTTDFTNLPEARGHRNNPEGIPSQSLGLTESARQPQVDVVEIVFNPERGCVRTLLRVNLVPHVLFHPFNSMFAQQRAQFILEAD